MQDSPVPLPAAPKRPGVRCRRMTDADAGPLSALLARGFPQRDAASWAAVLALLSAYAAGNGLPAPGLVLESAGELVGVLLAILRPQALGPARCNLSSWYVEPDFRSYAPLLVAAATRDKSVTYVNISSQRHTRPTIEAQGFRRYADGVFFCAPLAALHAPRRVRVVEGEPPAGVAVDPADLAVMRDHAPFDCLPVWCVADGRAHPFLFLRRSVAGGRVPVAHVVYCRDTADLARFARPLGRFLARRGMLAMMVDANAPLPGLPGRFLAGRMPKYAKGLDTPRLGDLSYTEAPLFGS
ncbi:acyl-CoA acyltransferase [Methylobacterium sp. sgz302541]|uniref:acyl-CoA acyltransferase n=1 Tax=unclassified Methylobacterium TaxID=2615210 RepID=UPI003D34D56A